MKVYALKTSDLSAMAAPYNPRSISDHDLESLRKSMRFFGIVEPIVANKRTNRIVGGHQRIKAAEAEGIEDLPVVWVDLDEPSEKQLNIALNKISGEFDEAALAAVLRDLEEAGADLALTGFSDAEVAALFQATDPVDGLTDPEATPEPEAVALAQTGDLITLGRHRLLCGDSLDQSSWGVVLDGNKAALCFTDPPYNIDYGNIKHPKFRVREIANDDQTSGEWGSFCAKVAARIRDNVDGCVYVCHAPGPDGRVIAMALDETMHPSTTVIWRKDIFTLGRGKYHNQYEPIWFGWSNDGTRFTDRRDLSNVWDVDRPKASVEHPTMKPVALVETAIDHASVRGDVVVDPFGGAGSTLIACERTGRDARLIEVEPIYIDVIVRRWQDFTGKKADGWRGNE